MTYPTQFSEQQVLNSLYNQNNGRWKTYAPGQYGDSIDRIFESYNATVEYKDDFSDGDFHGWQYQYDTTNRVGITLDDVAMTSTYSLLMHTRPSASDQAWCRKGHQVPAGVTKMLIGAYSMFHAANANSGDWWHNHTCCRVPENPANGE